uniref:Uncharacterized protein n=1 Tax=Anguilla anguilla TaxID=7936 RepID=A0A0E9P8N2_ANGAN
MRTSSYTRQTALWRFVPACGWSRLLHRPVL